MEDTPDSATIVISLAGIVIAAAGALLAPSFGFCFGLFLIVAGVCVVFAAFVPLPEEPAE